MISTDTCTFTREQKAMWEGDWTKIPMGMPGLETLLPLTYTKGVLDGRLTLEEMCMKLSTNPAKIMGLYPRKGAIQVGADADIAIIHPKKTHKITPSEMETNADWSPYEGWDLAGFSRTTLSRGDVIVDDYKVVGQGGPRAVAAANDRRARRVERRAANEPAVARPAVAAACGADRVARVAMTAAPERRSPAGLRHDDRRSLPQSRSGTPTSRPRRSSGAPGRRTTSPRSGSG